jgi:nucleoside-diphosphate-sugar epimerase
MSENIVFVTGGTGLVGSHLLLNLAEAGHMIRALKRKRSDTEVVKRIFTFYGKEDLYEKVLWVEGDITDVISLEEGIGDAQYVYHTAALVSFNPRDKQKLYKFNIEGTANVVNACLEKGVKKLCYVSSTAAVGTSKNDGVTVESNAWNEEDVNSNYAISKHYAENEVWRGVAEGLSAVIVNPCVIIGPGDWNRSSGTLYKTIQKGLKFYTGGANAFVDVRDVADAMNLLMNSDIESDRFLLIGENLSYKDLFTKIAVSMGMKPPSILVKGLWIDLFWRLEKVRTFFTRNAPVVTSESAQSAVSKVTYSADKFASKMKYTFRDINDATTNAGTYYKKLS